MHSFLWDCRRGDRKGAEEGLLLKRPTRATTVRYTTFWLVFLLEDGVPLPQMAGMFTVLVSVKHALPEHLLRRPQVSSSVGTFRFAQNQLLGEAGEV